MTAASKHGSLWKLLCREIIARRTRFHWGEAGVLGEEMGKSTRGARRGMGPSTCARVVGIMSGRTNSQQGRTTTCKDPAPEGRLEGRGGFWSDAWASMSEEGGVTPSEEVLETSPTLGNTQGGQRGPGHSVASGSLPVARTQNRGTGGSRSPRRRVRQTTMARGVGVSALEPRPSWEGRTPEKMESRGQNRTREIRPSGIVGGHEET